MNTNTAKIAGKIKILVLILIIATMSLGFYVLQGKEVTLDVDGESKKLVTMASTVQDLIEFEEVKLHEDTFVNLPLDSKLKKNSNIVVKNNKGYTLKDGTDNLKINSVYTKVSDVLKENHISLGDKDFTYPDLHEELKANDTLRIYRFTKETIVEETNIPFEKEVVKNNKLEAGVEKIVQAGVNGSKKTHIKKEFLNGVEVSSKIDKEEIVKEPVKEIKEVGTKNIVETSRGGVGYRKSVVMKATAYDNSPQSQGRWVGKTATGMKPQRGVVAVDPRVIPLGTKVYVQSLDGSPDYGFAVAGDTGGAIKGNRIDLFHNTAAECRKFGRRNVKVYILD